MTLTDTNPTPRVGKVELVNRPNPIRSSSQDVSQTHKQRALFRSGGSELVNDDSDAATHDRVSDVEFHDETGENDIQCHSCGKSRRIPPGNVDPRYKLKCSCGTRLDIAWNLSERSLTREQVPDNFLDRFVDNDDTHDRVSEDNVPDVPHADRIIESVRSIEGRVSLPSGSWKT